MTPGGFTISIPNNAISAIAQSGVPAHPLVVLGVPTATPTVVGDTFVVPPGIFTRAQSSQVPVPANQVVQQLDTTFIFNGPATIRTPSAMSDGGQLPGIASQTRKMQKNAWSKAGQPARVAANFNFEVIVDSIVTRRVTYTANTNAFGGTMGMLLDGAGLVYIVTDLLTFLSGNEIALSVVGDTIPGAVTVHMGRGYATTQMRTANPAPIFPTFSLAPQCTPNVIPPSPPGCDLVLTFKNDLIKTVPTPGGGTIMLTTMQPIGAIPGALTTNTGFPWTTGHVSAYGKGSQGGVAQTTTLTAVGDDSLKQGVRTIQLVAAGIALRVGATTVRVPHLETVTIQVPEPGSTLMLAGALGLLGGLYSVRRRFF